MSCHDYEGVMSVLCSKMSSLYLLVYILWTLWWSFVILHLEFVIEKLQNFVKFVAHAISTQLQWTW